MQAYLKKHGPNFSQHMIKVDYHQKGRDVELEFSVQKRTGPAWQTDSRFTQDWAKNWGLWEKDVVEAFLQLRMDETDLQAPYLEIQLSPLGRPFALIITEPRKTFFIPEILKFDFDVDLSEKFWAARMKVTLPEQLKGRDLYGGLFACLGSDPREYYALAPNPESLPDFHRPELFIQLGQL